jgi:hypothetical protein
LTPIRCSPGERQPEPALGKTADHQQIDRRHPPTVIASLASGVVYAVILLAACIASGYGCGTWLGKTLAAAISRNPDSRASWGDWCGIYGGLIGIGIAGGVFIARFV